MHNRGIILSANLPIVGLLNDLDILDLLERCGINQGSEEYTSQGTAVAKIRISHKISEIYTFRGKTWALKKIIIVLHLAATTVVLTMSQIVFFGNSFSIDEDTVVALLSGILIQIINGIPVLGYLYTLRVPPYFGKSKFSMRCLAYTNVEGGV